MPNIKDTLKKQLSTVCTVLTNVRLCFSECWLITAKPHVCGPLPFTRDRRAFSERFAIAGRSLVSMRGAAEGGLSEKHRCLKSPCARYRENPQERKGCSRYQSGILNIYYLGKRSLTCVVELLRLSSIHTYTRRLSLISTSATLEA